MGELSLLSKAKSVRKRSSQWNLQCVPFPLEVCTRDLYRTISGRDLRALHACLAIWHVEVARVNPTASSICESCGVFIEGQSVTGSRE